MAIPVISPLAAKAAPSGKATNPAGNDQAAADFAAVLAQQRPTDQGVERSPLAAQALLAVAANAPAAAQPLPAVSVTPATREITVAATANAEAPSIEPSRIPTTTKNQGIPMAAYSPTAAMPPPLFPAAAGNPPAPGIAVKVTTNAEILPAELSRISATTKNQGIPVVAYSSSAAMTPPLFPGEAGNPPVEGLAATVTTNAEMFFAGLPETPTDDLKSQDISAAASSLAQATTPPPLRQVAESPTALTIAIADTADFDALKAVGSTLPTVDLEKPSIPTTANSPSTALATPSLPQVAANSATVETVIAGIADQDKPGASTTPNSQAAASVAPLWSAGAVNPPLRAITAATETEPLPASLPGNPTVDQGNPGKMAATPAIAVDKRNSDKDPRGQANALEQLAWNPGLGLGLVTAASAAGQPTEITDKASQHPEKELAVSTPGAPPLVPDVVALTIPLTFPASNRLADQPSATAPLLASGSMAIQLPSEVPSQTANLAAETLAPGAGGQQAFSAALAAQQPAAGQEAVRAAAPSIDTPLQNPNWGRSFGEGIVWMAKNDQQSAQININPPQLGPVQITLHLNGDQANAVFASPHAEVRQAIQDAMPQLRDMLAASGINLGQADVGSQGSAPGREFAAQQGNQNRSGDENAILSPDTQFSDKSTSQPILRGRGLVDLFA